MPAIIAIGASQGGVSALRRLAAALPADFPAPLLVVQHIGAAPSELPLLLQGPLKADFGRDGEVVEGGRIYVAPADRHMLLAGRRLELTRGPRENWARPAIDPLFRSVAESAGSGAVGVIMTGRLNDGVAGLYEIKRRGGVAVVQTPGEAEAPEMPRSALENVAVDYCLPAAEMPRLLSQLARELATQQVPDMVKSQQQLGQPAAQTCPECGGAMREEMLGSITRFRCHIGHVMTGEVLASTQLNAMQQNSAAGLRFLNERVALCLRMAAKARAAGHEQEALHWQNAAAQAEAREKTAQDREAEDWIRPEGAEAEEA